MVSIDFEVELPRKATRKLREGLLEDRYLGDGRSLV
jgi:hypothetical protein